MPIYSQNPDKNGQHGCVLKKLRQKLQNVLTMVISIFTGVTNCLEGSIIFAKKCSFAKEVIFSLKQQFLLKT